MHRMQVVLKEATAVAVKTEVSQREMVCTLQWHTFFSCHCGLLLIGTFPAGRDIPCRSGHSLQFLLSQKGDPLLEYTLQDNMSLPLLLPWHYLHQSYHIILISLYQLSCYWEINTSDKQRDKSMIRGAYLATLTGTCVFARKCQNTKREMRNKLETNQIDLNYSKLSQYQDLID